MRCRIQDPGTCGKHQTKNNNPWCTSRGCRVQNPGPWEPWLRVVETSRLSAERAHSTRCTPHWGGLCFAFFVRVFISTSSPPPPPPPLQLPTILVTNFHLSVSPPCIVAAFSTHICLKIGLHGGGGGSLEPFSRTFPPPSGLPCREPPTR